MNPATPVIHIVDDDASFLTASARLLRGSGFEVKVFATARDFLAEHDGNTVGCVVVDLQMPEMNGLDLQAALALTPNPLPVVFLTGAGDIPSSVRAMRNGAEDFLEKRAAKETLIESVRRAVARDARERGERSRRHALRSRFDTLSGREMQVLHEVVRGRLNKQIADALGIRRAHGETSTARRSRPSSACHRWRS